MQDLVLNICVSIQLLINHAENIENTCKIMALVSTAIQMIHILSMELESTYEYVHCALVLLACVHNKLSLICRVHGFHSNVIIFYHLATTARADLVQTYTPQAETNAIMHLCFLSENSEEERKRWRGGLMHVPTECM